MKYRADIDGLRAVAVLAVVIFHAAPSALPGGFVGVDIFFVISGFLISGIQWDQMQTDTFSFSAFYSRRAWRLLPALYATLVATLVIAFPLFPPSVLRQTAISTASTVAFVSNVRFALQTGYFDESAYRKPLLHTWSLAVEEQFYFLWPVLLVAMYRYRHYLSPTLAIPALVSLVIFSEVAVDTHPGAAFFLVPFRMFQFLTGAALHIIAPPASDMLQEVLSVIGVLCTALPLSHFSDATPFPGATALLPTLATAALIHTPRSHVSALLASPVLTCIGRMSYSIYLVHWPQIVAFSLLSDSTKLQKDEVACLILASLGLGYALHHSVEARFRRGPPGYGENTSVWSPRRTLFLFASTGAVLCAAAYGAAVLADVREATSFMQPVRPGVPDRTSRTSPPSTFNKTELARWRRDLFSAGFVKGRLWFSPRHDLVLTSRKGKGHLTFRQPKPGKARTRMLLIGDSHAEGIIPLVLRMALEKGYDLDVVAKASCAAFLTAPVPEKCLEAQKYRRETLEQTPYDLVVLSSYWVSYAEAETLKHFPTYPQRSYWELWQVGRTPDAKTLHERVTQFMDETVDVILRSGAQVMIVGQVPEAGKNIGGCLNLPASKKARAEGTIPAPCLGGKRRIVLRRSRFVDMLHDKMARAERRITTIPSRKYFCDDTKAEYCRRMFDGRLLYKDSHHLSAIGSLFFSQGLRENSYEGIDFGYKNPKEKLPKGKEAKSLAKTSQKDTKVK